MILACKLLLAACTLVGPATVHDGDTIHVQGQSVRLYGVDAEELTEPHGNDATRVMRDIVGALTVTCKASGRSYNRVVATCVTSTGIDIGAEIIRRGAALDCARYSHGKYRALEPAGARQRLIQKPYC